MRAQGHERGRAGWGEEIGKANLTPNCQTLGPQPVEPPLNPLHTLPGQKANHSHAHARARARTRTRTRTCAASQVGTARLSRVKVAFSGMMHVQKKKPAVAAAVNSHVRCLPSLLPCCCEDSRRYGLGGVQVCDYSIKEAARREGKKKWEASSAAVPNSGGPER